VRGGAINWDHTNAPPPGGNPLAPNARLPFVSADVQWSLPLGPGRLTADLGGAMQHPTGEINPPSGSRTHSSWQAWFSYEVTVP
jgi:hypothetical protein